MPESKKSKKLLLFKTSTAAAIIVVVALLSGCQVGAGKATEQAGSEAATISGSAESGSLTAYSTAKPGSMSATAAPSPHLSTTEPSPQAVSQEMPSWLKEAKFENQYAQILHQLESNTLMALIAAVYEKVEDSPDPAYMPTFEDIKPALLAYNTKNNIASWQTVIENDPGWLLEPRDLLFAINMYEPSLKVVKESESGAVIAFKTYGGVLHPQVSSHGVTVELLLKDGDWLIDKMIAEPQSFAFSKEEVDDIMSYNVTGAQYNSHDEEYFYYEDGKGRLFRFDKKKGSILYPK